MEVLGYFLNALKELCSLTGFIYVVIGTLAGGQGISMVG